MVNTVVIDIAHKTYARRPNYYIMGMQSLDMSVAQINDRKQSSIDVDDNKICIFRNEARLRATSIIY